MTAGKGSGDMRTTVVRCRAAGRSAAAPIRCPRPIVSASLRPTLHLLPDPVEPVDDPSWSTMQIGVVASMVAVIVALVLDVTTTIPNHVIVVTVMTLAFAVSLVATARRPARSRR